MSTLDPREGCLQLNYCYGYMLSPHSVTTALRNVVSGRIDLIARYEAIMPFLNNQHAVGFDGQFEKGDAPVLLELSRHWTTDQIGEFCFTARNPPWFELGKPSDPPLAGRITYCAPFPFRPTYISSISIWPILLTWVRRWFCRE